MSVQYLNEYFGNKPEEQVKNFYYSVTITEKPFLFIFALMNILLAEILPENRNVWSQYRNLKKKNTGRLFNSEIVFTENKSRKHTRQEDIHF